MMECCIWYNIEKLVEKIINGKKDFLKWTSKSNYVAQ